MKKELSPSEKELFQRVNEVLYYLWDPIGVKECPATRDEYDGYAPHVFSMLINKNRSKDIENYLLSIEQDSMGMIVDDKSRFRAESVVNILEDHKTYIEEKTEQ